MASMSIKRCLALPVTLAENTIYIVLTDKAGEVQLYVTGHTGDVVRKTLSTTDVAEMIESSLQSNGIITVETLPTPSSEYIGRLFCVAGNENIPAWCDGTVWHNLLTSEGGGNSGIGGVDDHLLRRLRNELDFGIKLT